MKNVNINSNGGIGFTGLLMIVFITLKLCNIIDWAWVWVLSPLWISFILILIIIFIGFIITIISILMMK